ncbi:MAG TPA: hypothetical protein DEA79_16200 [Cyanobacteria bacterium UBA11153]|nr:hypothetical protein [Cyanobacteria bacterium UBA11153]
MSIRRELDKNAGNDLILRDRNYGQSCHEQRREAFAGKRFDLYGYHYMSLISIKYSNRHIS